MSDQRAVDDAAEPGQVVRTSPKVVLACGRCHDVAASEYWLRPVMGRYVLLCPDCWERSPIPTCEFKDEQGVQCTLPAECHVTHGLDQVMGQRLCRFHVPMALTPASGVMQVYPIEV